MNKPSGQNEPKHPRPANRFSPGNKFGAGRPQGSRNKATIALQTLLEGEAQKITRKAIEMALGGDSTAMRLVLERLVPVRKDRSIKIRLPEISSTADASKAIASILRSVGAGRITPSEGEALMRIISLQQQVARVEELDERLAALEERK